MFIGFAVLEDPLIVVDTGRLEPFDLVLTSGLTVGGYSSYGMDS